MTIHERIRERVSQGASLHQLEGEIARMRHHGEDEQAALWLLAWHYLSEREARMPTGDDRQSAALRGMSAQR
jgi:hypothetical protein